jgi:hypothetical protein
VRRAILKHGVDIRSSSVVCHPWRSGPAEV